MSSAPEDLHTLILKEFFPFLPEFRLKGWCILFLQLLTQAHRPLKSPIEA